MKYAFLFLAFAILSITNLPAQGIVIQMPVGFDTVQTNIPHRKIDSFICKSKTVGTTRQSLIYSPVPMMDKTAEGQYSYLKENADKINSKLKELRISD